MGKVTVALMAGSTTVMLVAFAKGMTILRGGDVQSHLYWAGAALVSVLAANLVAMFHAVQSDRIIRDLRDLRDLRDATEAQRANDVRGSRA